MSEEVKNEETTEQPDQSRVELGLHPLGGLGVKTTGPDGSVAIARLEIQDAWLMAGHLNGLVNMMYQGIMMRQMQAQAEAQAVSEAMAKSGIIIPK